MFENPFLSFAAWVEIHIVKVKYKGMSKDRFVAFIKTVLCQVLRGFLVTYTWSKVAAHSKQSFVSKKSNQIQ
jgi:hypothetical protein